MLELVESFPIKSFPFLLFSLFYIYTQIDTLTYTHLSLYIISFFLKNLFFPQRVFSSDISPRGPLSSKSLGHRRAVPRDAEQPGKEGSWHSSPTC